MEVDAMECSPVSGAVDPDQREFNIWNRYSALVNEFHCSQKLRFPCKVATWLSDSPSGKGHVKCHSILLGSSVSGGENYISVGRLNLPHTVTTDDGEDEHFYHRQMDKLAEPLSIQTRVCVPGVVCDALAMPQNSGKVASICSGENDVLLFDMDPVQKSEGNGLTQPLLKLRGNVPMGRNVSWNHIIEGYLLCASSKSSICLWDIHRPGENDVLSANVTFAHDSDIRAVCWHKLHQTLFGSVSDDRSLLIWDTRFNSRNKPIRLCVAHPETVNCLDFNPFNEYLLATGSADKTIALWDLRNMSARVHSLTGFAQQGSVAQVLWSPHCETMLASRGECHPAVLFWQLNLIGRQQTSREAMEGPPELFFIQGGQEAELSAISWNQNIPWTMCSVAFDSMHVWRIADCLRVEE